MGPITYGAQSSNGTRPTWNGTGAITERGRMSGWVKVDNTMPDNPKVANLSDRAFRTWMNAICYCSRGETDGKVPQRVTKSLTFGSQKVAKRALSELVDSGLFIPIVDGYAVHDYLAYNPSRQRIGEMREQNRQAVAAHRERAKDDECKDLQNDYPRTRDRSVVLTEEEKEQNEQQQNVTRELFDYWRDRCGHSQAKLTADRRSKIKARLKDGYTVEQIRRGIDGAARAPFVNDAGRRFDDIELICRSGSKLEDFIGRADNVVPIAGRKENVSDLLRAINAPTIDGDAEVVS